MFGTINNTSPQKQDLIVVNLTGVSGLPRELFELVMQAQAAGRDVEILNPSLEVQEYLRNVDFGPILIRGSTS